MKRHLVRDAAIREEDSWPTGAHVSEEQRVVQKNGYRRVGERGAGG